MGFRRFFGLVLLPAGIVLIIASTCGWLLAIADYFEIAELWGAQCPDAFHTKALLIGGVVIAVIGQRLYSGRNLRTGEKTNAET